MIEDDWLASAIFTTVRTGADLSKVKETGGDFQTAALSKAINREEINVVTVRAWLEKAGERRSTLVFCVDLSHVANLTAMFRRHGIDARFITGDTPAPERQERLAGFKAGDFPVLLNCNILTEGTDIPNVDCIVLARPTKSRNLLVQMIGRGLRKHADKRNCHVIDMVASLEAGIVTTPTLFGLDPDALVEAADYKQVKTLRERKEIEQKRAAEALGALGQGEIPELRGNISFTDYDTVNDLIQDTAGERHIRSISFYTWVQTDENKYILSNRDGSYISIEQQDEKYVMKYVPRLPEGFASKSPYAKARKVGTALTFEAAVRGADKFASETFPHDFITISAYWRKSWASDGQLKYLNKHRKEGEKLEHGSISKGRAADWITKMQHGARGRFSRMLGQKRKAEKKVEKIEKWRERQTAISVGPVSR